MFINKIKQNFAGFAVVALAFAGLSAVAPASATAYASNAGAVGDPNRSYSYNQTLSLGSNDEATVVVPANNRSYSIGRTITLTLAQSQALAGKTISFEVSMVSGGTTVTWPAANASFYAGNTYLTGTGNGVAKTAVWPSTGLTSNDQISLYPYSNSSNSDAVAAGTYTLTFSIKADGIRLTSADFNTSYVSSSTSVAGAIAGTLPSGANLNTVRPGYICIDKTQVSAGDVITARAMINGTVQNANNWMGITWTNGNTLGNADSLTLTSSHLSGGELAFNSMSGLSASGAGVAAGATFTADVSITKANGTEVSTPCALPTVSTPVLVSSSTTSVVATLASGSMCRLLRVVGNGYFPAGFATAVSGTCTITPWQTLTAGTYSVVGTASSYWSTVPVESTNNPTFTISSAGSSSQSSSSAPSSSNSISTPPTPPTNVPLVAPIAMPAAGFTPGGALTLSGSNLSNLTSVKIGETVAKTVASASGVTISVPADLTPGAHNLLITTSTGSTLFVGAIKVADPVVEAAKAAKAKAAASIAYRAPVDFTVNKSAVAQAAAAKAFAAQYRSAKTAICVAIPASKATSAAALAAATKVCDGFKASVPGIKLSVVLGAPSGDKINRVSAELQG